jgi:hypothetical protein
VEVVGAMAVDSRDGVLSLVGPAGRLAISISDVPRLLAAHAAKWPDRGRLVSNARNTEARGFQLTDSRKYVEAVYAWGRGDRNLGRVLENGDDALAGALRNASALLKQGMPVAASAELCRLSYVGQSFATKLVHFLAPDVAVILDQRIRSRLGYSETDAGYDRFLSDCHALSAAMGQSGRRATLAEAETVVFAQIQGY